MEAANHSSKHAAATSELTKGALRFGMQLTTAQLTAFEAYITTLLFWRSRLSLTGAATNLAIVRDHILDSFAIAKYVLPASRAADLGSGAGFPGVPLAIVCPQASVTLVESRRKRANFLRDVVRRCKLTNTDVIEARAEDLPPQTAGTFDVVVSRAVWTVPEFLKLAASFLRSGGRAIAMKGPKGATEILSDPGFVEPETTTYQLLQGIERLLLLYRKR